MIKLSIICLLVILNQGVYVYEDDFTPEFDQMFSISVENELYYEVKINNIYNRFRNLPLEYFQKINKEGGVFYITDGVMTDIDKLGKYKGVRPTGWSKGVFDDLNGVYYDGDAYIVLSNLNKGSSVDVKLHELGHMVDDLVLNNVSRSDRFVEIKDKEFINILPFKYYNNPTEYFAETFAMYYSNIYTRVELMLNAPETFKFIQELENDL